MDDFMEPNIEHMLEHLKLLYDWTHTDYPNAQFEVRCIPQQKGNGKRTSNVLFACSEAGYAEAIEHAVQMNQYGYNVYVTVNPGQARHCAGTA
jgi:hypothetical protein